MAKNYLVSSKQNNYKIKPASLKTFNLKSMKKAPFHLR